MKKPEPKIPAHIQFVETCTTRFRRRIAILQPWANPMIRTPRPFTIICFNWNRADGTVPLNAGTDAKTDLLRSYLSSAVKSKNPAYYKSLSSRLLATGGNLTFAETWNPDMGPDDELTPREWLQRLMILYDGLTAVGGFFAYCHPDRLPPVRWMPHPITGDPDSIRKYVCDSLFSQTLWGMGKRASSSAGVLPSESVASAYPILDGDDDHA